MGWCFDANSLDCTSLPFYRMFLSRVVELILLTARNETCCNVASTQEACFESVEGSGQGCFFLRDVALLEISGNPRCLVSGTCQKGATCVWPNPAGPVIRLALDGSKTSSVLFGGTRSSLATQITVGTLRPRFWWVPTSGHIEIFLELVFFLFERLFTTVC